MLRLSVFKDHQTPKVTNIREKYFTHYTFSWHYKPKANCRLPACRDLASFDTMGL